MLKNLFFIALLLTLALSCKKKETPVNCPVYDIDVSSDFTPYLFTAGSYWVYKDSASGVTDSNRVITAYMSTYYAPGHPSNPCPDKFGEFNINYYNYTTHAIYSDRVLFNTIERHGDGLPIYLTSGHNYSIIQLIATFSSLQVEGETYTDVKEFQVTTSNGYIYYYFSPFVGIIKKTTDANGVITTSNLLRYETVMYK
jgi:hypothetical protein